MTILEWIHDVVDGVGGLHDLERYELAIPNLPRDEAVVAWVLRCLGNPKCEGSQTVIDEIIQHRKSLEGSSTQ